MNAIQETLMTPITDSCDVLVVGGGFAGIAAALAAVRNGADVLLVEKQYILGGLGTAGLVTVYLPLCDGLGNQVSFGIAEELFHLSIKHIVEDKYPKPWLEGGTKEEKAETRFQARYNPHLFAMTVEQLLVDNGVRILYGTSAVAVQKDGKKISAVMLENKSGRSAVTVKKSVVDCTGDADICKYAGAKTALFARGNVISAWHYYLENGDLKLTMLGAKDIAGLKCDEEVGTSQNRFAAVEGAELSHMVQLSHQKAYEDLMSHFDTDTRRIPVTLPSIPQVRMTRRICGKYTMDLSEERKDFPDSVGMFGNWRQKGPAYHLPFSTLYGDDVDNLICAGRCISVTDAMWNISRVIPVCAVSGEAAGTAAAMTDNFSTLDVSALQKKLVDAGVKL